MAVCLKMNRMGMDMAGSEDPAPMDELTMILGNFDAGNVDLTAAMSVSMVDSRKSAGESGDRAAKGLSDVRRRLSVDIIAWGSWGVVSALWTSAWDVGVPWTMVRFGLGVSEDGLRTSAVTVWLLARAAWRVSLPLRPVLPVMYMCILR